MTSPTLAFPRSRVRTTRPSHMWCRPFRILPNSLRTRPELAVKGLFWRLEKRKGRNVPGRRHGICIICKKTEEGTKTNARKG